MHIIDLLFSAYSSGTRIWASQGLLHYRTRNHLLAAEKLAVLAKHKVEIVAALNAVVTRDVGRAGDFSELAPLSLQQQAWWDALHQGESIPDTLCSGALHFEGNFDLGALSASLREVIRRHEVLRTKFVVIDGVPLQHISGNLNQQIDMIGIYGKPVEADAESVSWQVKQQFSRKIDCEKDCLFDVRLFRTSAAEHVLAISIHQMLADDFSFSILFRDLYCLYSGIVSKAPPSLQHVHLQYADYAVWQRSAYPQWFGVNENRSTEGPVTSLQWPTDRCLNGIDHLNTDELVFELGKCSTLQVDHLARLARAAPAYVMLGAYAAVVSKWCKQCRLIVPILLSGRDQAEYVESMGFFARLALLRVDCEGQTLIRLIEKVAKESIEIQRSCGPTKSAGERLDLPVAPLFNWQTRSRCVGNGVPNISEWRSSPSLICKSFPVRPLIRVQLKDYRFELQMWNTDEGIGGLLRYRANLFEVSTMQRFLEDIKSVIAAAALDPRILVAA